MNAQLIGDSHAIAAVRAQVALVAAGDNPVLIEGETGTGKEVVARLLHRGSGRDPLVPVNCAGFSEALIDAELFGYVRGAFTGADEDRAGLFAAARHGTLFLDEIGDLPRGLQAKLLRVLESGEIRPVGATKSVSVDARVIAATNRDLSEEVSRGAFREDLYWRLNVWQIRLPSLRTRAEDIPMLVDHFLNGIAISDDALDVLCNHSWPGNVRELQHALEFAKQMAGGSEVQLTHLPPSVRARRGASVARDRKYAPLRVMMRQYVQRVYEATGNSRKVAAEILQIDRKTLARYLADGD